MCIVFRFMLYLQFIISSNISGRILQEIASLYPCPQDDEAHDYPFQPENSVITGILLDKNIITLKSPNFLPIASKEIIIIRPSSRNINQSKPLESPKECNYLEKDYPQFVVFSSAPSSSIHSRRIIHRSSIHSSFSRPQQCISVMPIVKCSTQSSKTSALNRKSIVAQYTRYPLRQQ